MGLSCFWWGVALLCSVAALFSGGASAAASTSSYPGCNLQHPEGYLYLGNGDCDKDYNDERCGFDGGDCCSCTCREGLEYGCGASGYNCVDPSASCFVDPAMALRDLQTSGEAVTSSVSPSSAPTASPTSFLDANAEAIASAAANLSSGAIGAIVAACVVVALIAGALYLYKKKQSGAPGTNFSTAESASLT